MITPLISLIYTITIKDITSFITTLPSWVKVLMVFTILPIYIFRDSIGELIKKIPVSKINIFSKNKPNVVEKIVYKEKERIDDYSDLLFHDFFLTLNDVKLKVKQIDFTKDQPLNNTKRKMMLKLIEFKVESIRNSFNNLIKDDLSKITPQEFKFKVLDAIRLLIIEYNKKSIDYYVKELSITRVDAEYFVNTYESYRTTIIDSFIDRLESICVSKQYETNYSRMLAMLEVLTLAVDVIPRDVKSLYYIINGRYDHYN